MDLRQNIVKGDISCPAVKSLHTIILKPKIAYATKQARCPVIVCLFIVSLIIISNCARVLFLLAKFIPILQAGSITNYSSTTTSFITTSVLGRSPIEVSTFCITSTTSKPSSTSPNTVYPPSRKGVPPCVV